MGTTIVGTKFVGMGFTDAEVDVQKGCSGLGRARRKAHPSGGDPRRNGAGPYLPRSYLPGDRSRAVKSRELSCTVSGIGSIPLICLHGWACDGSQFGELSELLDKDFRIFCPDLPGHGKTPLNGFNPGFQPYARLIADFSKSQKLERPVLLGHSMGGVLCLMAAAQGGIQPRAVINLDGSFPAAPQSASGFQSLRALINTPHFRDRLALMVRESFFLDSERDARCEAIVQAMCSAPDPVLHFVPEQAGSLCAEQILPNVRVPVLYVGSASPRFDMDKAASLIPRVTFEQIHEAGHFLHIYAARKLAATLRQFQRKSHSGG